MGADGTLVKSVDRDAARAFLLAGRWNSLRCRGYPYHELNEYGTLRSIVANGRHLCKGIGWSSRVSPSHEWGEGCRRNARQVRRPLEGEGEGEGEGESESESACVRERETETERLRDRDAARAFLLAGRLRE